MCDCNCGGCDLNLLMMDCIIIVRLECIENYKDVKYEVWIYMCKRKWILNMKIFKLLFNNNKYYKFLLKLMYFKKVY